MSFIDRIAPSGWGAGSRRELLIAGGTAVAATAAVMADCVLYQMATGGAEPGLALRWFAGAVAPWVAVFVLLRVRVAELGGPPSASEAGLLAATLAISVLLDAALIPPAGLEELAERVRSRLPLCAFVPLAARLRLDLASRPKPRPQPDGRLADARLITAAGNYVEVEGACGRRLLRMTLGEAAARLDPERHLRIHRSTVVALEMIARLERDRNGIVGVRLADGRSLRVGRSYRACVRAAVEG